MSTDTDDNPIGDCYYCSRPLDPQYDYSCINCTRQTCDNDSQVCQVDFHCNIIMCLVCMDAHLRAYHPETLEVDA